MKSRIETEGRMVMQYRKDKDGNDLSILAYGCMRFPKSGGRIDRKKTEQLIVKAVEHGVNYFDTAYIYPGSEAALGEILEKNNLRNQVYIADKLPHYLIRKREGLEKTFQEMLKRLRTDHIDYFLMHMLTDVGTWERLKDLGIEEWIQEKKESGAIRHIGFSYHGNADMFCQLVDAYDWEFCMIQYNYLDDHSQAGEKGLKYASSKGLPVMIMEPLRGGKLVSLLPEKAKKEIEAYPRNWSPAQWAFRWLWNQPEVTTVLSGMNSMKMLAENCRTASTVKTDSFTAEDYALLERVKTEINSSMKIGCTGCGYCMPCPHGVDIPGTFAAWNLMYSEGKGIGRRSYQQCTLWRSKPSDASLCIDCGKCEQHCPQSLEIRKELKHARKDLETVVFKVERAGMKLLKLWG